MHMKSISKSEAQQQVDQVKAFQNELAFLESENVLSLSDAQHSAVDKFHNSLLDNLASQFDIDRSHQEKQLTLGMRIASFLGALALAASIFFLFYQFWGNFSELAQVTILVIAPLLTFIATMFIAAKEQTGYYAKLLGLVSFACFVLNLSMLGQIFNITPSDNAFVVWGALALLLAYTCDIRLLLAAGIMCIIAFVSARMGTWSGMYWLYFGERPENFFPAAIILFFIPSIISHERFWGFEPVYRVFGLLTLFLPMLILSNWGYGSYLLYDPDIIEGFYQIAGFVFSIAVAWLGVKKGWQHVVNTGVTFFVIFVYTKFYDWWWEIMPKYLFFLIIGLTAVLFLMVFKRWRSSSTQHVRSADV